LHSVIGTRIASALNCFKTPLDENDVSVLCSILWFTY